MGSREGTNGPSDVYLPQVEVTSPTSCTSVTHQRGETVRRPPTELQGSGWALPTSNKATVWIGILGGQLATSAHEGGACLAIRGEVRRLVGLGQREPGKANRSGR